MNGVLADHAFITAVPFFVPTLAVVLVVGIVIWRDRHGAGDAADENSEDAVQDTTGRTTQDGSGGG